MKNTLFLAVALLAVNQPMLALGQGAQFTYQGRLLMAGALANGSFNFQFRLMDAAMNGDALAPAVEKRSVTVSNGLFTVTLDFGPVFNGSARWLEIGVRQTIRLPYTIMSPRQLINSAPYAAFAMAAGVASNLAGGGAALTGISGTNIQASSITSNQIDTVTWQAATGTATNIVQAIGDRRYAGANFGRAWLTPYDCGAVGDGAADDTVALQLWLNNATSSNLVAFLPAAVGRYYRITDTLWVTNLNGLRLIGTGGEFHTGSPGGFGAIGRAHIRQFTPGKHGLVIADAGSSPGLTDSVHIEGICVTAQTFSPTSRGIAFDGNGTDSDCDVIDECGIEGFGVGLYLGSAANLNVRACSFGLNGDGVLLAAQDVNGSPAVLNSIKIETSQLSYNYSNQVHVLHGNLVLDTCDIASVAFSGNQGAVGLRIEGTGFVDVRWCNFECYGTNPAVVATSAVGLGPFVRFSRGGINRSCGGCPGPNTYSVVLTNAVSYFDGIILNSVASDDFTILDVNTSSGTPEALAAGGIYREKFIRSDGVWTNYITGFRTVFTPAWPAILSIVPGQFLQVRHDNQDTELRFGASLANYYGTGVTWFDLLQYHRDKASTAVFNQVTAASFTGDGANLRNVTDARISSSTNSPPTDPTLVRAWINITNNGQTWKMPLYR